MYKYHIIKISDLSLELLETSKEVLKKEGFTGNTHEDLKTAYQLKHDSIYGGGVSCGYERSKDGSYYWVLPYPYNPTLDVTRTDGQGNIISKTYTLEELNNFGFDVIEDEVI